MWPRKSLRVQPSWLDSDVPAHPPAEVGQEGRADAGGRYHPRRTEGRRWIGLSFAMHEAIFDEQGIPLEEKAVRSEHALIAQFTAGKGVPRQKLNWAGSER